MSVPIANQIACVRREITMRNWVYPRWVEKGRMNQEQADRELEAMIAVLATLQEVQRQREPLSDSTLVTMYAECPRSDAEMIEFARAIERAHGIGGGNE